jgi:hypothetical protein
MSLSNPINPPLVNEVVAKSVSTGLVIGVDENQTKVNQLHGIAPNNTSGAGIPKQVSNVQVSVANAQTGATCTLSVLYKVDPSDSSFSGVNIWVKGYQGNSQLVQVASGTSSPTKFVLNNTGEILSITVQAFGNGGNAPLSGAPTSSAVLPKSTTGGFGSNTVVSYNVNNPPPSGGSSRAGIACLLGDSHNTSGMVDQTNIAVRIFKGANLAVGATKLAVEFTTRAISSGTADVLAAAIRRTLPESTTVIDSTPITWSGSATPNFGANSVNISDYISVPGGIDDAHEYWITICLSYNANVSMPSVISPLNSNVRYLANSADNTHNWATDANLSNAYANMPGSAVGITAVYMQ